MAKVANPKQNHLLDALLKAEFDRLSPNLELIELPLGKVMHEAGGLLQHVYFPTTSIILNEIQIAI